MQKIKKLTTVGICFLLIATVLASLVVATNEIMEPAISISADLKVDQNNSFMSLTHLKSSGLTTCPVGDGPAYQYLKVTCRNANGNPLPGIKSDLFDFTVTEASGTHYVGNLSCSFLPVAPDDVKSPIVIATNSQGEIFFEVVGDTTIIGNISIHVTVTGVLLNDTENLSCKSYDINCDGIVDCLDFDLFSSDYRGESGFVWRSDFNWDGLMGLSDFSMFALHLIGPCEQNHPPFIPRHPEPRYQSVGVPVDTLFGWSGGDPDENDTVNYTLFLGTDPSLLIENVVGTYPGNETEITWSLGALLDFDTTYYWKVNATDSHGAFRESRVWMFTTALFIDTEPPSPITGLTVTDTHDGTLNVTWNQSNDNVAVDYYVLSRDNTFFIPLPATWYFDTGLVNGQTYTYTVYAVDTSGNEGQNATANGTPTASNQPPYEPMNPSPVDGATDVNLSPLLNVTVSDPDGDIMDVFFYNASDNLLIGTNNGVLSGGIASISWNSLQYSTLYQWYVIVNDSLLSNTSAIWSFTTKNASVPSNPPTRRSRSNPSNQPPVADLSAGEPYTGVVGKEIMFDGFRSHDPDGSITSWSWEFGDGTSESGQQVTHTYFHTGIFTVSLVVVDNKGASGSDMSKASIVKANSPPSDPFILRLNGSEVVETLTRYFYTAQSNDADNDYLKYHFEWGDGTTTESIMLSGTPVVADHIWVSAGTYPVTVSAYDGKATSSSSISVFVKETSAGVAVENIALVILAILASTLFLLLFAFQRRKKDKKHKK